MDEKKYPSLSEISKAHSVRGEYERYLFANSFLFRPLSYGLTWLAVRLGLSSEAVSWLSGLTALAGFVCLLWPGTPLLWSGIGCLVLFNFLDCVDGDVSRIMRTRNPYGRFLDTIMGWADMLFWTVIGVTLWRLPELCAFPFSSEAILAAGVLASFFASYAVYLEGAFDHVLRPHWESLQRASGIIPAATPIEGKAGPEVFVRVLFHNLRVRETHYILLALACASYAVDLLLFIFLAVNAAHVLLLLFVYCRRGRKIYDSGLGREKAT